MRAVPRVLHTASSCEVNFIYGLTKFWEIIHCQGFRDVCTFCRVPLQKKDNSDSVWCEFPNRHCQKCNACFNCLVYYNESSLTENHCTWYEAHYRNCLKLTVLDEDLSQAQLAQLDGFLNFGVF